MHLELTTWAHEEGIKPIRMICMYEYIAIYILHKTQDLYQQ